MARGLDLKPEQKEFLTNISRMKGGRMVIDVSNMSDQFQGLKEIALGDLTENQKKILLENQETFKKMSTEDIAKAQYTETQKMALNIAEINAMLKIQIAKVVNPSLRGVDNQIAKANDIISQALKGKGEGGKEIERIKSKAQEIGDEYLQKGKPKKQEATKVDVSKKEDKKEETGGNTGGNSVMTVKHEFKDSSVVFDFSRQLFEESMTKNTKEYTTQIPYAPGFRPNK
jgi:hypothetical protein